MDLFSTKIAATKAVATKTIATKTIAIKTVSSKITANSVNKIVTNKTITANSVNKIAHGSQCGVTVGSNGVGGNCTVHPGGNPNVTASGDVYYGGHGNHGWRISVGYKF